MVLFQNLVCNFRLTLSCEINLCLSSTYLIRLRFCIVIKAYFCLGVSLYTSLQHSLDRVFLGLAKYFALYRVINRYSLEPTQCVGRQHYQIVEFIEPCFFKVGCELLIVFLIVKFWKRLLSLPLSLSTFENWACGSELILRVHTSGCACRRLYGSTLDWSTHRKWLGIWDLCFSGQFWTLAQYIEDILYLSFILCDRA